MSLLADFVAFIRDLLKPAPPVEDPNMADLLRSDEIARTEWVRNHRQQETHD